MVKVNQLYKSFSRERKFRTKFNNCNFFSAYPLSGMITVPVSAGTYQAVVASMQQGGGLTFHTAENANTTQTATQAIQLISAPLQLANGQM